MPFDNVKTRMQSIGNPDRNMLACAARMFRAEGVLVFWKATTPRLVRLTVSRDRTDGALGSSTDTCCQLSSSITFIVYDKVVGIMDTFGKSARDATTVQRMV